MRIIGITGKKRVGKNYVANLAQARLEQLYGWKVKQMAFAEPLKEVCKILFGLTNEQLEGDKSGPSWERWEELNIDRLSAFQWKNIGQLTVRELLQLVGTDLFRDCWSQTIWTRIAARRMEEAEAAGFDAVIFTDVRFPNEAATIEGMGGSVWKIEGKSRGELGADSHASENQEIAGHTIVNDEDVEAAVDYALKVGVK